MTMKSLDQSRSTILRKNTNNDGQDQMSCSALLRTWAPLFTLESWRPRLMVG